MPSNTTALLGEPQTLAQNLGELDLLSIGAALVWALLLVVGAGMAARAIIISERAIGVKLILIAVPIALATAVYVLYNRIFRPFDSELEWYLFPAIGVVAMALLALLCAKERRLGGAVALVVAAVGSFGIANYAYALYPTPASFTAQPAAAEMSYAQFSKQTTSPTIDTADGESRSTGALVEVNIPPTASGFHARPAYAYIPPAYWEGAKLPVVVLLAGVPGDPKWWFDMYGAATILDDYQRTHAGRAPIVVSVDATGSRYDNPLCIDAPPRGDQPAKAIQTWLTQDVPSGLSQLFRVDRDTHRWTIGGLSYGGTCAFQVVTNHPDVYGSFLDFSGAPEPLSGTKQHTLDVFFNGDESAFAAIDPASILSNAAHNHNQGQGSAPDFSNISGVFVAGESDDGAIKALTHLNSLATQAGMASEYRELPGGHTAQVWREALRVYLPFAARRGGIEE
ncbi:MAG: alpha/beta hydrolase-fold protein [Actinomycetaceae bacterium]|nr:alpha/beta hydrolase-fold protein [Arcanobacterium sp.]MDD7504938.1 alpha/beta hydrolase-fold protein [Actinomycetaceae bacterium]MDY6143284.1 alpha/beta hydrolase-fold protein [Arcanobacterium sp.]